LPASGAGGAPFQQLSNAAASTIYGAEVDFAWKPSENWLLQGGAGNVNPRVGPQGSFGPVDELGGEFESDWFSAATVSKGEYGVPAGLVFGYPCRTDGKGNYTVVEGVKFDAFGQQKFDFTLKELLEEK
jgi:outer membrane receptor protein involved in Fe transport